MSEIIQEFKHDHHDFGDDQFLPGTFDEPWQAFDCWMKEAKDKKVREPNAMSVSTVDSSGRPSTRMVYLKDFINGCPVFYTNYHSAKGQDIEEQAEVCLLLFWNELSRQIKMNGRAQKISFEQSEAYFKSRPYESQIGAWASHQSQVLTSKDELLKRLEDLRKKFPVDVPCPPHWGGYQVEIDTVEFWQGQASRLHDRVVFGRKDGHWTKTYLNP